MADPDTILSQFWGHDEPWNNHEEELCERRVKDAIQELHDSETEAIIQSLDEQQYDLIDIEPEHEQGVDCFGCMRKHRPYNSARADDRFATACNATHYAL